MGIKGYDIGKWKDYIEIREQENGQMEVRFHMRPEQLAILKNIFLQTNFGDLERMTEQVYEFGSTVTAKDYLGRGCFLCLVSMIRGISGQKRIRN